MVLNEIEDHLVFADSFLLSCARALQMVSVDCRETLARCTVFTLAVFMLTARGHSKARIVAQYLKTLIACRRERNGVLPNAFLLCDLQQKSLSQNGYEHYVRNILPGT